MGNLQISKSPFLVKAALFYFFVKIVDGFFGTLGSSIFQNMSPVLKSYVMGSFANLTWFYHWLTTTEIKISLIGAIFSMIWLYLIYRLSSKFV